MRNTKNENRKRQDGITLIALVITIIVLLILAGISISMLTGDNSILNQAANAKETTSVAQIEESINLAVVGALANSKGTTITESNLVSELNSYFGEDGYTISGDESSGWTVTVDSESYYITNTGEITDPPVELSDMGGTYYSSTEGPIEISENGETYQITIPGGFTVSGATGEYETIENGVVIYEGDVSGTDWNNATAVEELQTTVNQFVWIPVASSADYVRNTSYSSTGVSATAYTDTEYLPDGIQPTDDTSEANEEAERDAVISAGGFYISRYEAGDGTTTESRTSSSSITNTVVSKKEAIVYNYISQSDCKTVAKTYSSGDTKGALCSGIQWDMVMAFVNGKKDGNGSTYDVTTYSSTRHTGSLATTGNNIEDKVCNIYDLEGNCREYVAEKNTYITNIPYVNRGGYYNGSNSASYRIVYYGYADNGLSFRLTLYVVGLNS